MNSNLEELRHRSNVPMSSSAAESLRTSLPIIANLTNFSNVTVKSFSATNSTTRQNGTSMTVNATMAWGRTTEPAPLEPASGDVHLAAVWYHQVGPNHWMMLEPSDAFFQEYAYIRRGRVVPDGFRREIPPKTPPPVKGSKETKTPPWSLTTDLPLVTAAAPPSPSRRPPRSGFGGKRYDDLEWEDEVAEEEERERERIRDQWAHRDRMFARRVRRWEREERREDAVDGSPTYNHGTAENPFRPKKMYGLFDMPSSPLPPPSEVYRDGEDCDGMERIPYQPYNLWWRKGTHGGADYAYVTIVTSASHVMGAATLMYSVHRSQSQHARMILVTKEVSQNDRNLLSLFAQVMEIDKIGSPRLIDNARYADTFTKLRIWQLVMFKKVLYIDTDVIVLKNMDDLFDLRELSLPMDAENDRYSTGLMLLEPQLDTFEKMMKSLNVTRVSMELPDLLFLKEFFESRDKEPRPLPKWGQTQIPHHVINIIPRWYQVYQEEFGSQYSSYLTRRQVKLTIHDPRIHGMHYPGNNKPWQDFDRRTEKYEQYLCGWRTRPEIVYESMFLWFRMWRLMRSELKHITTGPLFDYENGEIISLSEWFRRDKLEKEREERKKKGNQWYNNNNNWAPNTWQRPSAGVPPSWNWNTRTNPPVTPAPRAFAYKWPVSNRMCQLPKYGIDLSRMIPFVALLPQRWVGHALLGSDVFIWTFTWCRKMIFTPVDHTPCDHTHNVAQFNHGACRTAFHNNLTLSPILGNNSAVLGVVLTSTVVLTDYPTPRTKTMYVTVRCDANSTNDVDAELEKGFEEVRIEDEPGDEGSNDRHYFLHLRSRCACSGGCVHPEIVASPVTEEVWVEVPDHDEERRRNVTTNRTEDTEEGEPPFKRCAEYLDAEGCEGDSWCEFNGTSNKCIVTSAQWVIAISGAESRCPLATKTSLGLTLKQCQDNAPLTANVMNFRDAEGSTKKDEKSLCWYVHCNNTWGANSLMLSRNKTEDVATDVFVRNVFKPK